MGEITVKSLHEIEISSIDWESFEAQGGDASKIPSALIGIFNATVEEAENSIGG